MTLEKSLSEMAEQAQGLIDSSLNEAQTIFALISPFIRALGYDTTNFSEVVPEYRPADVPFKQGQQLIDFAILVNDEPALLIECKRIGDPLDVKSIYQLFHYFAATEARIGILTNGTQYKFFSDLDEPNKMDQRPFLEIDLLELNERMIEELARFTREAFDVDATIKAAETLKYTRGMKQSLARQLDSPDEEFVKWLAKEVYSGPLMKKVRERFTSLARSAFRDFIKDQINMTLIKAMDRDAGDAEPLEERDEDEIVDSSEGDGIVTTAEEYEGYAFVKSIIIQELGEEQASRVTMRDMKTLCSIVMDGRAQRVICKFYFNNPNKLQVAVRDVQGKESRHDIESVTGIFAFADQIIAATKQYLA